MTTASLIPLLRRARSHGLHLSALHALSCIHLGDGQCSINEIAADIGISTAGMTGVIDLLEKHGFVTRNHSRLDRRMILVAITAKGIAALNSVLGTTTPTLGLRLTR
jgi:DNA-binding MarR family transcriptional regulator